MFKRTLNQLYKVRAARFSTQNGVPKPPEVTNFEFEPFKFQHERESLMYGYTMEELYGKRYGVKHSEQVIREMRKDNILFCLVLIGGLYFGLSSRERFIDLQKDWNQYIYHDMNQIRPIPDHVRSEI